MIRLSRPYLALLEALESLGLARKPTTQQTHALCQRFVEMVAEIEQQRVTMVIGQTVIAREHESTPIRTIRVR
jgi:hypothetical protein